MRQRHASGRAVEQPDTEPRLKLPYGVADRGSGPLQSLGRGPKAHVLGHEKEGVQVGKGAAPHWKISLMSEYNN
jgi:hypothetical protein